MRAYAHLRGRTVPAAGSAVGSSAAGPDAIDAAAARRAEGKVVALGRGEIEEADLSPVEVTSWIRYGLQGFFPDYLMDISVTTDSADHLVLAGRVAARKVPGIERLGAAAFLLGDTVPVTVTGRLDGWRPGRGVLRVGSVQLGPLPLPAAMRNELLAALGVQGDGGDDELPADAVTFPLPAFVTDIAVREGEIVLRGSGG
jgi:hypothetical protein